jgi:ankyrin repeat protein
VDFLIEERALVNSKDRTGRTPLQYALQQKHERIARRLLRSMSEFQFVQSSDWFELGIQETYWGSSQSKCHEWWLRLEVDSQT